MDIAVISAKARDEEIRMPDRSGQAGSKSSLRRGYRPVIAQRTVVDPPHSDSQNNHNGTGSRSDTHTVNEIPVVGTVDDIPSVYRTIPYNHEKHQDWVRAAIALSFAGLFVLTVIGAMLLAIFFSGSASWQNIKDMFQLLITAESGLLGAATGFYFGTRTNESRRSSARN